MPELKAFLYFNFSPDHNESLRKNGPGEKFFRGYAKLIFCLRIPRSSAFWVTVEKYVWSTALKAINNESFKRGPGLSGKWPIGW